MVYSSQNDEDILSINTDGKRRYVGPRLVSKLGLDGTLV